jgi:hypothetical protein
MVGLGRITRKSGNDFTACNLRFRPEWGNHKSAWGTAPGTQPQHIASPNGAAQMNDGRANEIINTIFPTLSGLSYASESPTQDVALG